MATTTAARVSNENANCAVSCEGLTFLVRHHKEGEFVCKNDPGFDGLTAFDGYNCPTARPFVCLTCNGVVCTANANTWPRGACCDASKCPESPVIREPPPPSPSPLSPPPLPTTPVRALSPPPFPTPVALPPTPIDPLPPPPPGPASLDPLVCNNLCPDIVLWELASQHASTFRVGCPDTVCRRLPIPDDCHSVCPNITTWKLACAQSFCLGCPECMGDVPPPPPPAYCAAPRGICNKRGDFCCPATCGVCGGKDCSLRPGGRKMCCEEGIKMMGWICGTRDANQCMIPDGGKCLNI